MEKDQRKIYAFIFARGGSKGIKNKNLQEVGGMTLIERSVRAALGTGVISRVIVSTDDCEIAAEAERAGAEVPFMRPAELASDASPELDSWKHAVSHEEVGEFDIFVSVPATAPLRQPQDLVACIDRYSVGDVDMVVTGTPSARSPYFNMVRLGADGLVGMLEAGDRSVSRRQDARSSFDLTTVAYVSSPHHIMRTAGVLEGRVGIVSIPRARAIDVDHGLDLEIARMLSDRDDLLGGDAEGVTFS